MEKLFREFAHGSEERGLERWQLSFRLVFITFDRHLAVTSPELRTPVSGSLHKPVLIRPKSMMSLLYRHNHAICEVPDSLMTLLLTFSPFVQSLLLPSGRQLTFCFITSPFCLHRETTPQHSSTPNLLSSCRQILAPFTESTLFSRNRQDRAEFATLSLYCHRRH